VCSSCRSEAKEHAPRCPASGAVIPRPISPREAERYAALALGSITVALAGFHGVAIDGPTQQNRSDVASGLAALSERYDFATLQEYGPWVALLGGLGSHGLRANKQGQARKAEKNKPKPFTPPTPASIP
jgi:hypothetical protein